MAKATQKGRLLSIITGLGEDYLLINKLAVTEGISRLFSIDVELLFDEGDSTIAKDKPTVPDIKSILGQAATISIDQRDDGKRYFNGIFKSISLTGRTAYFSTYQATIVPQIWELTQNVQSRIFQQESVIDILKKVFAGYQIKFKTQETYEPRNYCVQYNESDFDFASRLMEEEGISYYFQFSSTAEEMIITDASQRADDCPKKSTLGFHNEDVSGKPLESAVKSWLVDYKLQSGKITYWDYNFQQPKKNLAWQETSAFDVGGNRQLEVYKYPAGYARKYDGINKGGGEQSGEIQKIFTDNKRTVKNRIEALDAEHIIFSGDSNCCTFTAGYRFQLKNHPNDSYNIQYLITSVRHETNQHPQYVSTSEKEKIKGYSNLFTCIPIGTGKPGFRPAPLTPKPIIYGSQTALVVGPAGEEIFTDKYGRVKVQFHWDRYGTANSDSSCWVRVSQSLAGNKWGSMFIPRIGMEVIVDFLEGNPDEPIITGCVYNPDTMPPYTLPDEKTKSTLKTNSSKGGGGFNEFRIEDKKGEEQIFIHGEKNLDVRIKNDAKEIIKNDRHLVVGGSQSEKVSGDKHLKVTGNQNEQIDGSFSQKVGSNIQAKAGQKIAHDAGMEIHLKAGMTATIEAGTSLTLKVGGNFININPGGVFISGTMVMLNSGGAAGSGSGSNPTPPKDALEADNAVAGQAVPAPKPPPPTTPRTRSQKSAAMQKAAKEGTPFVSAADNSNEEKKEKELKKAIDKLGKAAKKTVDKLAEKAEKAVDKLTEKAEKAVTNLGKKVEDAIDEAKALEQAAEDKLKEGVAKVKETVNDGISKLKKAADQGKEALKKAGDKAEEKLKKIEEGVEKAEEKLEEAQKKAAEMKEKAQEKIAAAKEKATEVKNEVEEKIAETKKEVEEKAEEAQKALEEKKEEIAQGLEDLKNKFNPF